PWLSEALNTESAGLTAPRDPRGVVIANMLKDIDFSIANLPESVSDDRLTKYAALSLKAEICLYEATFLKYHNLPGDSDDLLRKSVDAYESIINSGLFSLYSTGKPNDDYRDLFIQY